MNFLDGPAAGTNLDLKRAPRFLRVVIDCDGTVDALDQLNDAPKPTEAIHVYRRQGPPARYHVLCTPRRLSGWHLTADYRLSAAQPDDATARDQHAWREWAARQFQTQAKEDFQDAQNAPQTHT